MPLKEINKIVVYILINNKRSCVKNRSLKELQKQRHVISKYFLEIGQLKVLYNIRGKIWSIKGLYLEEKIGVKTVFSSKLYIVMR